MYKVEEKWRILWRVRRTGKQQRRDTALWWAYLALRRYFLRHVRLCLTSIAGWQPRFWPILRWFKQSNRIPFLSTSLASDGKYIIIWIKNVHIMAGWYEIYAYFLTMEYRMPVHMYALPPYVFFVYFPGNNWLIMQYTRKIDCFTNHAHPFEKIHGFVWVTWKTSRLCPHPHSFHHRFLYMMAGISMVAVMPLFTRSSI